MKKQDYHAGIKVEATSEAAFNSINEVSKWWSKDFEGSLQKPDDIFTVHFGEVYIRMKVVEYIPGKKIVWYVTDCNKPWLKNKKEWKGTQLIWEISENDHKTNINFTHLGLLPEIECFDVCSDAWGDYIKGSLFSLITTGKGKPTAKMAR